MRNPVPATISMAAMALATVCAVGCANKAELPPQMTQSLVDFRDQLMQGKAQVQTTCNAARDVTQRPQAQVQPQVDRFVQAVASLERLATNNRQQFASADERAQAYFAHWDQQLQGMSASMAQAGQERREESVKTHDELKRRVDALRAEFRPFMSSVNEIARYLQTDPTAAGVKAVTPQVREALDREKDIIGKADAVIAQIDAMRAGS